MFAERVISENTVLFAGCGGVSLGLFNAGWRGIFAIEKSEMAFETLLLDNSLTTLHLNCEYDPSFPN